MKYFYLKIVLQKKGSNGLQNDKRAAIGRLKKGLPPGDSGIVRELSAGIQFLSDFWREKYLLEYIAQGGSKIKFVTGRPGSGKTHFLELMLAEAEDAGYKTVFFSSKDIWLHDFKEIYFEILRAVDIMDCLAGCGRKIIRELGFDPAKIPEGQSFADYLAAENLLDALTKREIRQLLAGMFLRNPLMDHNFAYACSLLTGYLLGYPTLEEPSKELLLGWLSGSRDAKLPALRKLGLSPSKITKYNARHMLRSLAQAVRGAGYAGLFVAIDNLEMLVSSDSLEAIRYTKLRREDAYESIRQLIDDIDTLSGIMFVFAFERGLLDDDRSGIKSYQALWMRIQNEVSSERFNRFADIVDLDRLAKQEYSPGVAARMSEKLAAVLEAFDDSARPIGEEAAAGILERIPFGKVALPRQINAATIGGMEEAP